MRKGKDKILNLYFDCEFTGLHKDTTLISLGIISDDNQRFYAEFADYDINQCNDWIKENVINNLTLQALPWSQDVEYKIESMKKDGWEISDNPEHPTWNSIISYCVAHTSKDDVRQVCGSRWWVTLRLQDWLSQFESIQFVSDVCHYDFVLLIDLFGTAWDLPDNISPVCHDINTDIAYCYAISEREAFNKSREEIVKEFYGHEIDGKKHNALYDAEVIKAIYDKIYCGG